MMTGPAQFALDDSNNMLSRLELLGESQFDVGRIEPT